MEIFGFSLFQMFGIFIVSLAICILMPDFNKKYLQRIEKAFGGRAPLTDDEFYTIFYGGTGIPKGIVIGIKAIFKMHFGHDLRRLHKTDGFSKELAAFIESDDMVGVEIILAMEHEFSISISDEEAINLDTFDDSVQLVWAKVRAA